MKVIHLSGSNWWGGNEKQLLDLSIELNKRNIYSEIHCVSGSVLENKCKEKNTPYFAEKKYKAFQIGRLKKLCHYINHQNFDLIHIHTSNAVTYYMFMDLLFSLKAPAIFSRKGIGDATSIFSQVKYNYRGIKKIFCVSAAVKNDFEQNIIWEKNLHKLAVVYDGVNEDDLALNPRNIRENLGIEEDAIIIGNIANHVEAKDLMSFVKVAKIVAEKNRRVHFVQIGKKTKLSSEVIKLVEEYQIQDRISFLGFVKNASGLIPQFNVYLMTSKREGLPLTIYEAFYYNTLVVSTAAGGIPEAVKTGKTGFISDLGNINQLSEMILKGINLDADKKSIITENARNLFFDKFNIIDSTNCAVEEYKKILNPN